MKKNKTKKLANVDTLLAAPDVTKKNKAERAKFEVRKAHEAARKEQLRAAKLKSRPSVEDMLRDVVRVAECRLTNPRWMFRSISETRYELFGNYPLEFLVQEFGQFAHAKQAAGLEDEPGTRLWRANRAKESRREHTQRYVDRHIAPYVVQLDDLQRMAGTSYVMPSLSDTHSQHLCPFVWLSFCQFVKDTKPDGVLLNGDILEGAEISSHPQIPGWTEPLQSEFDFAREMVRQLREDVGHRGDIFWTGGNHDVDRLAAYMTRTSKATVSLRDMRIDVQLGLQQYGVKLFAGGTIASPRGTESAKPGFLMFGHYRVHHGVRLGQNPALDELRDAGRSGQSGHVHRASLAYGTNERSESLSWMTTPAGCRHEAGRAYMKGSTTGWNRGFGFARIFADGGVAQYPVVVQPGEGSRVERLTVEGYTYERPRSLKDPEPHGLWIHDYRLGAP